uniref:Putative plant transposon protein domain-containing protein n=1 Tax=Solanum tuberosum TaxID=4113 RepID=M1DBA0_SOLTU
MRIRLILKSTYEIGIAQGRNVLAIKAHVNTMLIVYISPLLMNDRVKIKQMDMNVGAHDWFGFINNTIMSSQNESVLQHQNVVLVDAITDWEKINMGSIIVDKTLMCALQEKTSLSFPVLIT